MTSSLRMREEGIKNEVLSQFVMAKTGATGGRMGSRNPNIEETLFMDVPKRKYSSHIPYLHFQL